MAIELIAIDACVDGYMGLRKSDQNKNVRNNQEMFVHQTNKQKMYKTKNVDINMIQK